MVVTALVRSLVLAAVQYGVAEALLRGDSARRRIMQIVKGLLLLAAAALSSCLVLAFLLASLFFKLADQSAFIMPSLVTGLVGAVIVIVLVSEGWRQLRR